MTGDRVVAAALALCCLFALGASSATLSASVGTTPDDVIDFNYATLPLPSDQLGSLKEQVQSSPDETADGSERRSVRAESGDPQRRDSRAGEGGPRSDATDGSGDRSQSKRRNAERQRDGGLGARPKPPSLVDRLLALLAALLDFLAALLPFALLVGSVAAGVRYRRRLRAALDALLDRVGHAGAAEAARADGDGTVATPTDDVGRAWYEMARRLGLDDDRTATPRRVAEAAVRAGVDREVVEQVTGPFEEVRYGGAPVTDERRERAREGIERFRAQHRGGGR